MLQRSIAQMSRLICTAIFKTGILDKMRRINPLTMFKARMMDEVPGRPY
jgi:hypothetical protein